jgi:hypothetical protein
MNIQVVSYCKLKECDSCDSCEGMKLSKQMTNENHNN